MPARKTVSTSRPRARTGTASAALPQSMANGKASAAKAAEGDQITAAPGVGGKQR